METITKTILIDRLAKESHVTKVSIKAIIDNLFVQIKNELAAGNRVSILGFGSFEVRDRAARNGKNPATGEAMVIPASKNVGFKAGKELKIAVKK